ncbi:MAG TPA: hypothetical protein VGJ21_16210 [Terracidiphilus sp.]
MKDPSSNPSTAIVAESASAPLPRAYEAARTALAQCTRIDECAEWANRSHALASYARQANDDTLQKHATRIQARAIRRCGELLKEFDARPQNGNRIPADPSGAKQKVGAPPLVSRRDAAVSAGLSVEQQKTAVRVANVPAASFEAQVESDDPPTVTKLAELGRKSRPPVDLQGRDPKDFSQAT